MTDQRVEQLVHTAEAAADRGLDADELFHDHRMRLLAYAQVQATLALVEAMTRR